MAKIKLPTKSPHIDMTPMVDLFSLLLTFFMLTTSFRPQEAKIIDTPSSISEKQSPEKNILTISISNDKKVYINFDNGEDTSLHFRSKILEEIGKRYDISFTKNELEKFGKLSSFGFPIKYMKKWLAAEDQQTRDKIQKEIEKINDDGIPIDSTDNQFEWWIHAIRTVNPNVQVAIKGDADAEYEFVRKILDVLQNKQVNKFNLITNLEKVEVKLEDIN